MAMSLPTGVYYVYYQPGETQLFLMLNQNSQVPTVKPLSPGLQSQQWQVSAGIDANARTLRNIQFGTYIGRSFIANQDGTLAVNTPVPWYMTSMAFGPGWWKMSANPGDAGPWWVIQSSRSGVPELQMYSGGWMIFFFLEESIVNNPNSSSISTSVTASIGTPATTSPSTPQNGLSSGDVAALASSIPIGLLSLLLAALSLWYARKQARAGKPLLTALKDDIRRVRHPSRGY